MTLVLFGRDAEINVNAEKGVRRRVQKAVRRKPLARRMPMQLGPRKVDIASMYNTERSPEVRP